MTAPSSTHKSGSTLLTVILIVAVASLTIIGGSAAVISSLRQRSSYASTLQANRMLASGFQEGMRRLDRTALLNGGGEYGVGSDNYNMNNYSLVGRERGYLRNSSCLDFQLDGSGPITAALTSVRDSDCPSYQLAIRRYVAGTSYSYSSQDFPLNQPVELRIKRNPGLNIQATNVNLLYQICTSADDLRSCDAGTVLLAGTGANIANTVNKLVITATSYNITSHADVLKVVTTNLANHFVIAKGFTTIDVTAVAGESTQRAVKIIREHLALTPQDPVSPPSQVTRNIASQFSAQGVCAPNPNDCR